MATLDTPSDPSERRNTVESLRTADRTVPQRVRQMRALFGWEQPDEFYEGLFRGLTTAAELLRNNPTLDPGTLGSLLLIEAGIVGEYLDGESPPTAHGPLA